MNNLDACRLLLIIIVSTFLWLIYFGRNHPFNFDEFHYILDHLPRLIHNHRISEWEEIIATGYQVDLSQQ